MLNLQNKGFFKKKDGQKIGNFVTIPGTNHQTPR